jgi:hypothetical protein
MTVASFFRKYSVGCILNYVSLIIIREIPCIYIQLLLQLCTEVSQVTTFNENLKLTNDVDCFSLAPQKISIPMILAYRVVLRTICADLRTIFACAAL